MLEMTVWSGLTISTRLSIMPKSRIPISMTATSMSGCMDNSVNGTPMSLFLLPSVLCTLYFCDRTDATRSFVLVFPELPVIPTIGC